jgi:hypothetical protein
MNPKSMRLTPVLREIGFFALFLVIAIALTWPLAANLKTAVSDLGDPLLNTWILDWDLYAFTHEPLHLFDAPIFAPAKYPLAYSENLIGIALLIAPLHALGASPITLYNLAMLLGFAMSGYGMCVLVRTVGKSPFASIVAGILFGFCTFKFDHLAHVQIIWSGWLPLLFAALFAFWRLPSIGRAGMLAAAFVMNGLTNIHWLLFGSLTLCVTIAFLAAIHPRRDRRFWFRLAGALVLGGLVLLPFLIPYRTVAHLYGMRRHRTEVAEYSAVWTDWFVANTRSLVYGRLRSINEHGERRLFPGGVAIALAVAAFFLVKRRAAGERIRHEDSPSRTSVLLHILDALIAVFAVAAYLGTFQTFVMTAHGHVVAAIDNAATPLTIAIVIALVRCAIRLPVAFGGADGANIATLVRRSRFTEEEWAAALWVVIGFLGSLGLNAFFHSFLFRHVGVFQSLRVPARWAMIAYVGLALWAASGIDAIVEQPRASRRRFAQVAIALLAIVDVMPRIRWEHAVVDVPPVYRWLARKQVQGPVLELPMSGWNLPFQYLLTSTAHHVPIMNGTSGFEPSLHAELNALTEHGEFNDVLTSALEANGCELIVVHTDWLGGNQQPAYAWIREGLASGHLAFVRRFDEAISGDYVFALSRTSRGWQRLRSTASRDAAGFTDDQNLERLLAGKTTYNSSTFGNTEAPRQDDEVHGPLTVSGWALSPNGIARVLVRVHSGRYVYGAALVRRADVSAMFPWYARTPNAGFFIVLPKRPKGVPRRTDVQVQITDGSGNVTTFPDRLLTWD